MFVLKLSESDWKKYELGDYGHQIAFNSSLPPECQRIDYGLLLIDRNTDLPVAYMTCREFDKDTVYWQFGGALPPLEKKIWAFSAYLKFVEWHKERYKRITTLIENDNVAYLKFAMKAGFRIIGLRVFKGKILLEHVLEFGG